MTDEVEPFRAIGLSRLAHRLKVEGRSILHMEFGQPSTGAPAAAVARAHQVLDSDGMGYWESPDLRARIARLYRDRYDVEVHPDRIVLTCGASPALVLALTSRFRPGARIAMARPGYVAYRNTVRALGMTPVEIGCGPGTRFQLTADLLSAAGPIDGVILASPANPTGSIIPEPALRAIAAWRRSNGVTIISDEIYHGLTYGEPTPTILSLDPDAMVINSFSKYWSMAGWRLGWLVAGEASVAAVRAHAGQGVQHQGAVAGVAGDVAFQLVFAIHGDQTGVLAQRRGRQEHVADMGPYRGDTGFARHQPAQPPTGHAPVFGEAVDH
ncbi:MAG: aminotransferase class I/II-fold pyridoxal phosphate-dependent enzyme, partial [Acetobacteraceae bacterium]